MKVLLLSVTAGLLSLGVVSQVQAQHGHGHGGHGYGHGRHGYGHGGHGYGGHGYGHGYSHRTYGLRYGHGYGQYYYPGHGPSYYPSHGYGYYYPHSIYVNTPANWIYYQQSYYQPVDLVFPNTTNSGRSFAMPNNQACIQVVLPDPQAEVLFGGERTSSVGRIRQFEPPELRPGKSYTYIVTARWNDGGRPVTHERKVTIVAGQFTVVDFTLPAPTEPTSPVPASEPTT